MPWIQIKLNATAKSANKLSNMLMGHGAQAVTYMDAQDNPVYEPCPVKPSCGVRPRSSACLMPR